MATRTKPVATKRPPKNPPKAKNSLKAVGQPIERGKTYTVTQLRQCLAISRPTLHRYMHDLGLKDFVTPLQGKAWQITGDSYHEWLEWRRERANAAKKSKSNGPNRRPSTAP